MTSAILLAIWSLFTLMMYAKDLPVWIQLALMLGVLIGLIVSNCIEGDMKSEIKELKRKIKDLETRSAHQ